LLLSGGEEAGDAQRRGELGAGMLAGFVLLGGTGAGRA